MSEPTKLVLIDGHALVYRAYFALPPEMATSQGELTNAVFGFASMLLNVLRDEQPEYIAVTFDLGRTFRHEEYAEYKANRAAMPDDLRIQFQRIHELLAAFHIPTYSAEGFEADDVLAALAEQAEQEGVDTLIVTGDTDTFQLIGPRVRVLAPRRSFGDTVIYDEAAIRNRYGLEPRQLIDYKALIGDKSDNVPGVRGIGDKTATKLLQEYGSVEAIYEHLNQIGSARFRTALEQGRTLAFLSKHLVTIVHDVPVDLDLESCRVGEFNRERVAELFRQLEFRSLLDRLPDAKGERKEAKGAKGPAQLSFFDDVEVVAQPQAESGYQIVDSLAALEALVARLSQAQALVVDVESTSIDPMAASLVGIALSAQEGQGYYVPVGHQSNTQSTNLPMSQVTNALKPLLQNPGIAKYAHNANYDLTVLAEAGLDVEPVACDTMIAEWLINPGSHKLGLKDLAFTRLGVEMTPIEALIGSGSKQITMDRVPVAQAAPYACADADMTLRLAHQLLPELHEKALWPLFAEVEMPLVPVIVDMQRAGVKLDIETLAGMGRELGARLDELQTEIEGQVGHPLNINSTQQLSVALFDEMGLALPWMRRGKSGHYSTAADVLEKLRDKHPVVERILEHRQLSKLKGTYVDALPALVNPHTGRVHTSYNQTGSVTGRFSSSNPNLQNIPIRTELGREIRKAFIAEAGCRLLAADYSQVELRVLAHISGDPAMLAAFARGEDIHASTAAAIYGAPLAQVTPAQRRVAKMTNFAISYGVTGYGLSERTGLSPQEAEAFIQTYFQTYPQIRAYIDRTQKQARDQGYVETLLGRRRYFPELSTQSRAHYNVREAAYRMAINAPIQGCLPAETRVLTSDGYHMIGDLGKSDCTDLQVWTGVSLAPFQVLNRGVCELAELEMENGLILRCDTRHEVLVVTEDEYVWKNFAALSSGDRICLALPQEHKFGADLAVDYQHIPVVHTGRPWSITDLDDTFYYWLGFYMGDGWIYHNPSDYRWNMTFCIGSKVDCFTKEEKVEQCVEYFQRLGLEPRVRHTSPQKSEVIIYSKGLIEFLSSIGLSTQVHAHTKRVPGFVFGSTLSARKAFLRGMLDADGHAGSRGAANPNIHLCQRELLQDLWLLFRTVGVEGKIRGPYHDSGNVSYRLDLIGGMLQRSLGFSGRTMVNIPNMAAPRFVVEAFLSAVLPGQLSSHSHKVVYSRLRHGGVTSVYNLADMVRASGIELPVELYTWSALREKRALGNKRETFTLSVADPLHRFDSEGVISKNTAADILKVAVKRLWDELQARRLRSRLILQVHDELVLEVPEGELDEVTPLVIDIMEGAYPLDAPLKVDAKVGKNWLEMNEYEYKR